MICTRNSYIQFNGNSTVSFNNNRAMYFTGGAVASKTNSNILLHRTLAFTNNIAEHAWRWWSSDY